MIAFAELIRSLSAFRSCELSLASFILLVTKERVTRHLFSVIMLTHRNPSLMDVTLACVLVFALLRVIRIGRHVLLTPVASIRKRFNAWRYMLCGPAMIQTGYDKVRACFIAA